jgi:predicted aspartyl protease
MLLLWIASRAVAPAIEPSLELPFDFLHNQIVLQAMINGQGPYNAVLDTGTHRTTIDVELAGRLRLPLATAKSPGVGAGSGRVLGRHTACDELRIGDLAVTNHALVAMDLSKVSQVMGRPLGLVLGFNFLDGKIVQIDYFRRRVRFLRQRPLAPPAPRRISFPMEFRSNSVLPVLEDCYVNGTRIPVTLDTGSSLALILFPAAIRHLGLEELARQGIPLDAAGYGGRANLNKGWIRSVKLGAIDLGAIEVAYVEKGYSDREALARRGGNLGNAVLQDFVLTLDYCNRVVVLEAIEDPLD